MKIFLLIALLVGLGIFYFNYKYKFVRKFTEKYLIDDKDDDVTISIKVILGIAVIAGGLMFAVYKMFN